MTQAVSRHRRSRRGAWIVGAAAVVVLAVGAGAAVTYANRSNPECEGSVDVTVVASPDQATILSRLADEWNQFESGAEQEAGATDGKCGGVAVHSAASSDVAGTLSADWEEDRDGARPDVWIPDASTWLVMAAGRPDAARLLPPEPPSLASTPAVLAMQQPMAEALGWPQEQIGWSELATGFARGETWERYGHPEWGALKLGFTDPTRSTAGQAGVLAVLDPDGDGTFSDEELLQGIGFTQAFAAYAEQSSDLLQAYQGGDPAQLPAAFPVLERDLAIHADLNPDPPLVPLYPPEGVLYADYPYTVLDAPWVGQPERELAEEFLDYLRGPEGRKAYAEAGFRDPEGAGADVALLSSLTGFADPVPVPARAPEPEVLADLLGSWPNLLRPNNALIVLDTSGSMDDPVPGTELTRLELLQAAAIEGVAMLNNETTVGLWEFSSELDGGSPYRELVPMGPADEELAGTDRRSAMVAAVQGLQANGGTGLYDTIHDSYLEMHQHWRPEALNMLVVITDGRDEDHDGRSRSELLDQLAEAAQPDRPLPIIAIAVGPEADAESLEQITEVTGGRTIIGRDDVSAIQQVVLAFAGRISG